MQVESKRVKYDPEEIREVISDLKRTLDPADPTEWVDITLFEQRGLGYIVISVAGGARMGDPISKGMLIPAMTTVFLKEMGVTYEEHGRFRRSKRGFTRLTDA